MSSVHVHEAVCAYCGAKVSSVSVVVRRVASGCPKGCAKALEAEMDKHLAEDHKHDTTET